MEAYKYKAGGLKLKQKDKERTVKKQGKKKGLGSKKEAGEEFVLCEGRVVSNEVTVQGFETKFVEAVKVGDTIGINHPTSMDFEERTVINVLSQRTLHIDMPFSTDLISTSAYFIRRESDGESKKEVEPGKRSQSTLTLREKTGMWSYKVRTQVLDEDHTAEDLLNMRIKQTGRDKYC